MKSSLTAEHRHNTNMTQLTWSDRKKLAHEQLQKVDWRRVIGLSLFFSISGVLYALILVPYTSFRLICPFYEYLGIYDAGEGLTSAIYQTLHGNFHRAFRLNAILFIAPPLFALWYILKLLYFKRTALLVLILTFTITTLYGVLRNFEQFSYLRPTWVL